MLHKYTLSALAVLSVTLLGGGCATQPPADLARARASVAQVSQNPQVAQHAAAQLREAQATLNLAVNEWEADADYDETAHLAYLAEQKAGVAVAVAQAKVAEAEAQNLRAQRDNIQLSAREREAELAAARAQALEQQLAELKAKQTERGILMSLQNDVLFEYDQATLKPGATLQLQPLITFLKDHPERTLLIEGHTDSTGSDEYNVALSQRRAAVVRDYLAASGISPSRIDTRGYGESYPVASNDTVAGRQLNRRVDLVMSYDSQRVAGR